MTRSITSLSNATLLPYANTAPYGSSFVESNLTASRASSSALVRARRDEGLVSVDRASGGDSSSRSGIMSFVPTGDIVFERSLVGGGESLRFSTEDDAVFAGEYLTCRACENAATAARFADAAGRIYACGGEYDMSCASRME